MEIICGRFMTIVQLYCNNSHKDDDLFLKKLMYRSSGGKINTVISLN